MPPPADAPDPTREGEHRDLRLVARQGALQFAGSLANAAFAFLLVVVAARTLGRATAGAFLVSIGAFQVLATLTVLGADVGLIRTIPRLRATGASRDIGPTLRVAIGPVAVAGVLVGLGVLVLAPTLAEALSGADPPERILPFLRALAPFIPLAAVTSAALGATRGFGTVLPSVSVELVAKPASRPVLLGAVVALGLGSTAVALSYGLPILIGAVVVLAWLGRLRARVMPGPGKPSPTAELARRFWAYAAPRGVHAVVITTTLWLDVMLLSGLRTAAEAAVYTAATRFLVLGEAALHAVVSVISPQVSRLLAEHDRDGAATIYRTSTWWLMSLTWPLFLAMAAFAPLLLKLFGSGFAEGATALTVLSLASLASMAVGPAGAVLLMAGHSMLGLAVGGAGLGLNLALNLVLIPRFGLVGAAWAWATSIVLTNLAGAALLRRLEGMSAFAAGMGVVATAALATYGALGAAFRLAFGAGVISFAAYAVIATVAYGVIIYRFRGGLRLGLMRDAILAQGRRRTGQSM
jgi:O-antigen/teichoic acid export membrane protein